MAEVAEREMTVVVSSHNLRELEDVCDHVGIMNKGKVIIEESPLLMWCLANAIEIQNNYGDIKLSKKHKDDTERIDPLAAVMNALARALVHRQSNTLADALGSGEFTL